MMSDHIFIMLRCGGIYWTPGGHQTKNINLKNLIFQKSLNSIFEQQFSMKWWRFIFDFHMIFFPKLQNTDKFWKKAILSLIHKLDLRYRTKPQENGSQFLN